LVGAQSKLCIHRVALQALMKYYNDPAFLAKVRALTQCVPNPEGLPHTNRGIMLSTSFVHAPVLSLHAGHDSPWEDAPGCATRSWAPSWAMMFSQP
jgi:hypothetical protein